VGTDAIVVGAGAVGLAAARELARAGHDVLVLEQLAVGHANGSSHGSTRIFRVTYDQAEWVRLAQEALPLWRELEQDAGTELVTATGALDLGRDLATLTSALDAGSAPYELLSASEVATRFGIAVDSEPVLLQPEGGVCWASRTLDAFRAGAERHGARTAEGQRAHSLEPRGGSVRVDTSLGPIDARVAVVAAGAWARPLLATAGIDLPVTVTRETAAYFELAEPDPVPSLIDWRPFAASEWGLARAAPPYALMAGDGLLKAALHHAGREADPDETSAPDEPVVRCLADWVARTFALKRPEPVGAETCLYTSTADERFVLERHGPIVVGSACSGHGFKFAPAVGRRLAELAG
jgi:sarcosine oxidase